MTQGTQTSELPMVFRPRGMTPTRVYAVPSSSTGSPTTPAARANCRSQSPSLMITARPSLRKSASPKGRPMAGTTPSTSKNRSVTFVPVTLSGVPRPARLASRLPRPATPANAGRRDDQSQKFAGVTDIRPRSG